MTVSSNLIEPTIYALASENDILLVVTTKDADTMVAEMVIPEIVRITTFILHQELLKHVDVMVTNGGYGGVLTALSMGVPLIGAGVTEGKALVNARIAWSGVGIDLKTNTPSEEQIRRAVRRVINDGKFEKRAREIQTNFGKEHGRRMFVMLWRNLLGACRIAVMKVNSKLPLLLAWRIELTSDWWQS